MAVPVYYKRKLIGSFEGEFYGDDFCILESRHEIPGYPGITGKTQVIANVLYDNRSRKAGLEVAWIEGLQFIEGYKAANISDCLLQAQK